MLWNKLLHEHGLDRASRFRGTGMEEATLQELGFKSGSKYNLSSIPQEERYDSGLNSESDSDHCTPQKNAKNKRNRVIQDSDASASDGDRESASEWLATKQQEHRNSPAYAKWAITAKLPCIKQELTGRTILFKFNNVGWCKGRVEAAHTCTNRCNARCEYTHQVKYSDGEWPQLLSERRYGDDNLWVLLERPS